MTNQYKYGRKKELLVAADLTARGAKCRLSLGSRGPADVKCRFPIGRKLDVQVKSTRKGQPRNPSSKELSRLEAEATKTRSTPVVAEVARNKITYTSARSGRGLAMPAK